MFYKNFLYLKHFDWILFFSVLLLTFFGLAEIYSIALSRNSVELYEFKKQVFFVLIGVVLLFVLAFFDYNNLRSFSIYFYLFGVFLLLAVLFFGKTVRGTTGWFNIFGFSLQPVEFVKIILMFFLARYFAEGNVSEHPLKYLIGSGFALMLLAVLVIMQPDFGSALLLFFIWGFMVFLADFKLKHLLLIVLILILIFGGGWLFFFKDYQKERILSFVNGSKNDFGQSYNVRQAIIATGSGGLLGRGIGFGSQSQLKFLPESQNDFIFAVIAEELGFFGVVLVVLLYTVFFLRLMFLSRLLKDNFAIYFSLAVMGLIFIEMFTNIGMNIGLLPVVGISLPFLSYGGSAMISSLIMVGIIENMIIQSKIKY